MRLFLAVHPQEQFLAALTPRLDPVRAQSDLAWTPARHWHLTLHFLGDWPAERSAALQTALAAEVLPRECAVTPGCLGVFPEHGSPRVLFLQMAGDGQLAKLAAAAREIVNRTWPDGPQDNRPFRGHLTLARGRGAAAANAFNSLVGRDLDLSCALAVTGISLVSSELGTQGARHRQVAFYALRKKGE